VIDKLEKGRKGEIERKMSELEKEKKEELDKIKDEFNKRKMEKIKEISAENIRKSMNTRRTLVKSSSTYISSTAKKKDRIPCLSPTSISYLIYSFIHSFIHYIFIGKIKTFLLSAQNQHEDEEVSFNY
jgi:hypothetical protein